mmetsp:Transcript_44850/g.71653  ORF Transcript_44850/g.71653 Transcript_44850/m.71653 type:complete len:230 (+) Transcript_44850:268-957(+)
MATTLHRAVSQDLEDGCVEMHSGCNGTPSEGGGGGGGGGGGSSGDELCGFSRRTIASGGEPLWMTSTEQVNDCNALLRLPQPRRKRCTASSAPSKLRGKAPSSLCCNLFTIAFLNSARRSLRLIELMSEDATRIVDSLQSEDSNISSRNLTATFGYLSSCMTSKVSSIRSNTLRKVPRPGLNLRTSGCPPIMLIGSMCGLESSSNERTVARNSLFCPSKQSSLEVAEDA